MLACAARAARGQAAEHNSMLIHVSRFKNVHQKVFEQVDERLTEIKRSLRYRSSDKGLLDTLESLWGADFVPTSGATRSLEIGNSLPVTTWDEVKAHLHSSTDKIRPLVVNGEMRDAIDYDGNSEKGLSVIAIGGDKLSRGLTLEGLTVSYFLRASKMYDSLMQMGRWFGYRPGYVDLCRLYLTPELQLWFRHIAKAADELRDRLDHMAMIGSTPENYGLRIQSHDIMLVTAQNKMHHAPEYQVSFEGEAKIQTLFFNDRENNAANAAATVAFLEGIGPAFNQDDAPLAGESLKACTSRRKWKRVAGSLTADFLSSLRFPEQSRDVNGTRIAEFIRAQIPERELTDWTVIVLAGDGEKVSVGPWQFATVNRKPVSSEPRYVIKTVLSPPDEALDLTSDEHAAALEITNSKRAKDDKSPTSVPDGPSIREIRGRDPRRGLLLIYPLSSLNAGLPGIDVPIFGIVVSFPNSGGGRSVRYRINNVGQLELL